MKEKRKVAFVKGKVTTCQQNTFSTGSSSVLGALLKNMNIIVKIFSPFWWFDDFVLGKGYVVSYSKVGI